MDYAVPAMFEISPEVTLRNDLFQDNTSVIQPRYIDVSFTAIVLNKPGILKALESCWKRAGIESDGRQSDVSNVDAGAAGQQCRAAPIVVGGYKPGTPVSAAVAHARIEPGAGWQPLRQGVMRHVTGRCRLPGDMAGRQLATRPCRVRSVDTCTARAQIGRRSGGFTGPRAGCCRSRIRHPSRRLWR